MAWAKLHTDILGDPKLMRAARKGAKGLHLLPWLIAFAKEANDDGRLTVNGEPAEPADIAPLIPGATSRALLEAQATLKRIGVLVADADGALRLAAWERRSGGGKPSDQPDAILGRVHRFREKRRNADPPDTVTPPVTPDCNALQPPNGNATEVEGDEKKKQRQKKPRAPRAAAIRKGSWLEPFAEAWRTRYDGELTVGQALKEFGNLCAKHDRSEVIRRWNIYLDAHPGAGQYANPTTFAKTWGQWEHPPVPTNGKHPGGVAQRTFEAGMKALEDM